MSYSTEVHAFHGIILTCDEVQRVYEKAEEIGLMGNREDGLVMIRLRPAVDHSAAIAWCPVSFGENEEAAIQVLNPNPPHDDVFDRICEELDLPYRDQNFYFVGTYS